MAYDFIGLLDRHSPYYVSKKLKTSTDENDDEVVRFVFYGRLIELKGHWDGVEYGEDDGDGEVGVRWPDGVWV